MTRIHRWSIMIHGGLQPELMEIKHNSLIRSRYGTPTFGNIVVYVSKPIYDNDQVLWRL